MQKTKQGQTGAISSKVLLLLAALSICPALTLAVRANYNGNHDDGLKTDSSCTYGASEITYDANEVATSCKRSIQKMRKCSSCSEADKNNGVDCGCEAGSCVDSGSYQNGNLITGTCTKTTTNCVSGTLAFPWKFLQINANGQNCYTKDETINYTNQCSYGGSTPCS